MTTCSIRAISCENPLHTESCSRLNQFKVSHYGFGSRYSSRFNSISLTIYFQHSTAVIHVSELKQSPVKVAVSAIPKMSTANIQVSENPIVIWPTVNSEKQHTCEFCSQFRFLQFTFLVSSQSSLFKRCALTEDRFRLTSFCSSFIAVHSKVNSAQLMTNVRRPSLWFFGIWAILDPN